MTGHLVRRTLQVLSAYSGINAQVRRAFKHSWHTYIITSSCLRCIMALAFPGSGMMMSLNHQRIKRPALMTEHRVTVRVRPCINIFRATAGRSPSILAITDMSVSSHHALLHSHSCAFPSTSILSSVLVTHAPLHRYLLSDRRWFSIAFGLHRYVS